MTEFLLEVGLKSLPLAGLGVALAWLMRSRSASARFTMIAANFAMLAVLPIAVVLSPKIAVIERTAPVAVSENQRLSSRETVWVTPAETSWTAAQVTGPTVTVDQAVLLIWLLGALACWTSLIRDILSALKSVPTTTRRGTSISWASADGTGPFVWGWLRPKVVLPSSLRSMDGSVRSALIAHEMAHVHRGDWALRIAFRLIRGLYWFNPLVWLLEKRAAMESELACDDLVVSAGTDPARYAEGLLEVAKMQRLSTAPGAGSPRLKTRLVALLDKSRDRSQASRSIKVAAFAIAIVGTGAIAPLSVGSESPVETTMPSFLETPSQSTLNQMPAKATPKAKAQGTGVSKGQGVAKATQGKGSINKASAQGGVSGKSELKGQGSINRASGSVSQGGGGINKASGQGSFSGASPAGQGGGGFGGSTSVNANGQAPSGAAGSGQGGTINSSGGSGSIQGKSSAGGAFGKGGSAGGTVSGGGFGRAPVGAQGGGGTVSAGGFKGTANGGGGSAGATYVTARAVSGLPVSADGAVSERLGTKIEDLGNGLYRVTHNTDLGSFTAQGRNIELYKNGVLVLSEPLPTGKEGVRHVAGFVTDAMKGRGSIAYVRSDAP